MHPEPCTRFWASSARQLTTTNLCDGPAQIKEWATALPRHPSQVDILLVRKEGENGYCKDFRVRQSAIRLWLNFLIQNNPAYEGVQLDEDVLNSLPEGGCIGHLLPSIVVEEQEVDAAAAALGVPGTGVLPPSALAEAEADETPLGAASDDLPGMTPHDSGAVVMDPSEHEDIAAVATLERLRKANPRNNRVSTQRCACVPCGWRWFLNFWSNDDDDGSVLRRGKVHVATRRVAAGGVANPLRRANQRVHLRRSLLARLPDPVPLRRLPAAFCEADHAVSCGVHSAPHETRLRALRSTSAVALHRAQHLAALESQRHVQGVCAAQDESPYCRVSPAAGESDVGNDASDGRTFCKLGLHASPWLAPEAH